MYGDTTAIRRLAGRLREQAGDIRAESRALRGCLESTVWSGMAADTLRAVGAGRLDDLEDAARRHEEAADALDRHAEEVDRVQDLIAAIQRRVSGLVDAARARIAAAGGLLGDVVAPVAGGLLGGLLGEAVSGAVAAVDPVDPADELLARFVPPPPGHVDWLDVDLPGLGG